MTTKTGTITSAGKMQDTVTVTVHMQVRHPIYKKSFRQSKKFLVDTKGQTDLGVGDEVIIQECRPLSKTKHFMIKEVLKRAARVSEMAEIADTKKAKEANEEKEAASAPASK